MATFFILACPVMLNTIVSASRGPPVVLIPGDGGVRLVAKPSVPHWWCYKNSEYYDLWLNLEELAPFSDHCWADNIRLVYNETTRRNNNSPGAEVVIRDFGHTNSVEWLDPSRKHLSIYFNPLVEALVKVGYVRGRSVRGAPYDFRRAPNEYEEFYKNLTSLIEETYKVNGNKRVVLITHSMGGPVALYFLNAKTKAWKENYIESLGAIAPPWAGFPKVLRAIISGDNVANLNALVLRIGQRSFTSSAWLIPSYKYWDCNEALVFTPQRNYSVCDLDQLFDDMMYPIGKHLYRDTKDLIVDLKAPEVKVFMMYGEDLPTENAYVYDEGEHKFPDDQPAALETARGDGTVTVKSINAALKWTGEQKEKVVAKPFAGPKGEHREILENPDMINYVLETILGIKPTMPPKKPTMPPKKPKPKPKKSNMPPGWWYLVF